jgi:hypothetical protein
MNASELGPPTHAVPWYNGPLDQLDASILRQRINIALRPVRVRVIVAPAMAPNRRSS